MKRILESQYSTTQAGKNQKYAEIERKQSETEERIMRMHPRVERFYKMYPNWRDKVEAEKCQT